VKLWSGVTCFSVRHDLYYKGQSQLLTSWPDLLFRWWGRGLT